MDAWITQITQLTHDVKSFHINVPEKPDFKSGQFLVLNMESQGKLRKRAYSIASPNHWDNVEIIVKLHPEGKVTPVLFNKEVGDKLDIALPYGMFNLPQDVPQNVVFIGGGVGLAPLLSMIRHLEHQGNMSDKTLIYGNRTPHDIVYKDELNDLAKEGKLRLIFTIDHPEESHQWDGEKGFIDENMIGQYCDVDASHFYICGPPQMVSHMVQNLEHLGVDHKRINNEQW